MNFARRYLAWLTIRPAAVALPLAFLFLLQVLPLTTASGFALAGLLLAYAAAASLAMNMATAACANDVEATLDGRGDASRAVSECLQKTTRGAITIWPLAGLVFAIVGTLLFMRTALGFGYFVVAAVIVAFPCAAWAYAAGKHYLVKLATTRATTLRYIGKRLSLGRKIAIVFMASLLIAVAVLIALISSRVSTTLEQLAIASASERFQRLMDNAGIMAHVEIDTLRVYVPNDYTLYAIDKNGKQTTTGGGDTLSADEVNAIRRVKTGDSSTIVSSHVFRFAELKDGSILVMAIPWTAYASIPRQIAFYTAIVALLTILAFAIAAYYLSRDVTAPINELQNVAKQMAAGNFDVTAHVFSDDEVGQLAGSFVDTRENLGRLLGRIGGSGTVITEGVRVITGGTESLLVRARDQADLTENSSLALENVRGGISSVLNAADTVTGLTSDASSRSLQLQASADQVARSMDYLFQSVEKTSSSTTEMDASMREMSNRTDVLAGIGDEVLSFVAEMDSTVEELRQNSQSTAEISRQVREDAEDGGDAVKRTLEGISLSDELTSRAAETLDELQRSVGQISQILNVIEEVTNRTNLLALNAAIIAAQAGEHGAGFTVVADEIRELADRTRGSTKEIGEIIKKVQNGSRQAVQRMHEGVAKVRDNVNVAREASESLSKIVSSSATSYEMATKISRALDDQAKASRHLHEVSSRMSDHIAEINRATREQARGTQLLAQEAEKVREIAAQVKKATDEQSQAGRGITSALENIAFDARAMRDQLQRQLNETDRIAEASKTMLDIAQQNDSIAREFNATVQNLVRSGQDFETEVKRFRIKG